MEGMGGVKEGEEGRREVREVVGEEMARGK